MNSHAFLSLPATLCLLVTIGWSPTLNAQYAGAKSPPNELQAGFETISPDQCRQWLNVLAGPGFEGRGTGQEGYVKAAHWVAGKCAEFGLQPMGDAGTYFQMLPMSRLFVDEKQSQLTGPEGLSIPFKDSIGLDRFTKEPALSGKLVFLSAAGETARLDAELSLRDKIVILTADEAATQSRLLSSLMRKRPVAVLRVSESTPESTSQLQRPGGRSRSGGTSGMLTRAAAEQLLEACQGDESWLSAADKDTTQVYETEQDVRLEVRVYEEPASVPNVLAWLPGSDPELQHEYLVIGAHLDHLGVRGDLVYPGADDNGSGSTAILSIARALSVNATKPKRSVLLMWFAAEEMGLVGSRHYVQNPILPIEDMICMLNIDMVGRNEEKGDELASENERSLHLVGSQRGDKSLHELILEANQAIQLEFEFDEEDVFGRSDQINFFNQGTSVAFLFGGFHPDYHRPTDQPTAINYRKIASAAKLFYLTAFKAAEHGHFPSQQEEPKTEE